MGRHAPDIVEESVQCGLARYQLPPIPAAGPFFRHCSERVSSGSLLFNSRPNIYDQITRAELMLRNCGSNNTDAVRLLGSLTTRLGKDGSQGRSGQ